MRAKLILGAIVLVSVMATSCTNDVATEPTKTVSLNLAALSWDTHDPHDPPPSCDPHDPACTCDPHDPDCVHQLQGRMTGGGGQIVIGDVFVSRGFTIHCDITLSNNIEINWPDNKWHLDKPISTALCLDNPNISPVPPEAPFDTFIGTATGRLNGVDGSLLRFVFVDAGEPGKDDQASLQIFDPNGVLVLDVPLSQLDRGNIQAHFDQPHK